MKNIAMYLPQFHRVPENDEWWGEGFTEWTAVKEAKPLFDGHCQPVEPLNDNYYDLMDKQSFTWQTKIAGDYGIDGFCFYHYYFKNGRKILEKPAEHLLCWKDIPMHFCFCWANETWARTWSNVDHKNAWAEKYENSGRNPQETESGILIEQGYGDTEAWKEHFMYLLPFLQDERYICTAKGNPVFLIYKPLDIPCLAEMAAYWNMLCKEYGIGRLYVIGMNLKRKIPGIDAVLFNGPNRYWIRNSAFFLKGIRVFDYEQVWKSAMDIKGIKGIKTYFGGFVGYDDTPRHGYSGTLLKGTSISLFEKYFRLLVAKNKLYNNEFLFINAWNEWGEGMHLEPDKKDGCGYLEAIKRQNAQDVPVSEYVRLLDDDFLTKVDRSYHEKYLFDSYYILLDKWMTLREKNISVYQYFSKKNYKRIAVYGLGPIGRHLCRELEDKDIEISYIIDRNRNLKDENMKIKTPDEELDTVDAVIVTAAFYFDEIKKALDKKLSCPIISMEKIIEELVV